MPTKRPADKLVHLTLFCDGASRGNPGPAAYGFAVVDDSGKQVASAGAKLGIATNNTAEYQALLEGLKKCRELGAKNVTVKSDSELLVRQLGGAYKVRSEHLIPLYLEARELLKAFARTEVLHIPREENTVADTLANEALDRSQ